MADRATRSADLVLVVAALGVAPACIAPVDLGGGTSAITPEDPARVDTALPRVPATLTNVVTTVHGDSVGLDFDPVDDAADYRVYPLPADADVSIGDDGSVTVRNAVYRCAGARQTFDLQNNLNAGDPALLRTRHEFSWNATIPDEPTLGYVYVAAGSGRVPVYAVAGNASTDEAGWRESRTKIYTTDAAERAQLLSRNYRDDGIAFYVPGTAGAGTRTVYRSVSRAPGGEPYQHYFDASALAERGDDPTAPVPAFEVLTAADGAATKPLMVVGYDNAGHDELAVGKERFARASHQGAGPLWHLEWSGLTKKTTLVVEALDTGCPYQGFLATDHVDAPPHQAFETLDDLKQGSATGEAFVNGQFDGTALPKAIARSFVTVSPSKPAAGEWDFYEGFDGSGAAAPVENLDAGPTCFRCIRHRTSKFDVLFSRIDERDGVDVMAYGELLGQLWLGYDDTDGGTLGRADFTVLQKARLDPDPDRYLHIQFATGIASTGRRFPELVVSDKDSPNDLALADPDNHTFVLQVRGGPPVTPQLIAVHGLVNGTPWAVDNPDPALPNHPFLSETAGSPSAYEPPFEHAGIDRMTKVDVYVSRARYYVLLDGAPAGCTSVPPDVAFDGPATVTFSDVFFDEAAEGDVCIDARPYDFLHRHSCHETSRRFDDLAFKSGVAPPDWDEARFPCAGY